MSPHAQRAVDSQSAFGRLLREWRARRRVSQLGLAVEADVSSRHVSFIETGRAQPSREMVLMLARVLDIPLRDRNELLMAAGYAAMYRATDLDAPALEQARRASRRRRVSVAQRVQINSLAVAREWRRGTPPHQPARTQRSASPVHASAPALISAFPTIFAAAIRPP
jgi:transcriptional regulator with XRE-family HTH domain